MWFLEYVILESSRRLLVQKKKKREREREREGKRRTEIWKGREGKGREEEGG